MKNFVINTGAGDTFTEVSERAKSVAIKRNVTVEFSFNDVTCIVDRNTNLEFLQRDYMNSWTMGWKEVGPDCPEKYSPEVQKEYDEKKAARDAESKKREEEYERKEKAERELVEAAIIGVVIDIIPDKIKEYEGYVAKNSNDGYSRGVIDYGEYWAKLMQIEIAKGRKVNEVADECRKNLGFLGITGFMYGCAVSALSHFWKHGEELRKWHNKEWGVPDNAKGVANPAVFTISQ